MSSVKHCQQPFEVYDKLTKSSTIGTKKGLFYIVDKLISGTNSVASLRSMITAGVEVKQKELDLSLLLLQSMQLIDIDDDTIIVKNAIPADVFTTEESFADWFIDKFIEYVMSCDIINVDRITYDISLNRYIMSPTSISHRYAGFRNILVDFDVIKLRNDAHYTVCQRLDEYICKPDVRRRITEKQLLAQLEKKKELGNIGEEWVLEFEKRRITNKTLSSQIRRISIIDVGAGFDIVSFNSNESLRSDRFIEVKTFKGSVHFHWSHNEIQKARLMGESYYLYLVDADCLSTDDYEPQIIQNPIIAIGQSPDWLKKADSFLVEPTNPNSQISEYEVFENTDNSFLNPLAGTPTIGNNAFKPTKTVTIDNVNVRSITIGENNNTSDPKIECKLANSVFVNRKHGRELDLVRLYEWISDHFVERIQQDNSKQYIWSALYLFCIDNKLLCHNCARKDFVEQMNDWFSWCNVECTEAQIRRYKCLEGRMEKHIGPNEFDQIPDKQNASHLGYLEIERIYNDLKKHYNEDLLLKGIAIK